MIDNTLLDRISTDQKNNYGGRGCGTKKLNLPETSPVFSSTSVSSSVSSSRQFLTNNEKFPQIDEDEVSAEETRVQLQLELLSPRETSIKFSPRKSKDLYKLDLQSFRSRIAYKDTLMELRKNGVEVHLGYDNVLKEHVAVKILHTTTEFSNSNVNSLAQYENELETLKFLTNDGSVKNIQQLLFHLETPRVRIMVSKYCPGGDLMDYILNLKTPAKTKDVVKFLYKMTTLLENLHKKGIAHRDIKPDNIFLKDKNDFTSVLLGDFGHGAKFQVKKGVTPLRCERVGTQPYVAPEIVEFNLLDEIPKNDRLCDKTGYDPRKADVFSLGVTAYCLLTASFPYESYSRSDLMRCFIRLRHANVSKEMSRIVMGMMRPHPNDRYSTTKTLNRLYDIMLKGGKVV